MCTTDPTLPPPANTARSYAILQLVGAIVALPGFFFGWYGLASLFAITGTCCAFCCKTKETFGAYAGLSGLSAFLRMIAIFTLIAQLPQDTECMKESVCHVVTAEVGKCSESGEDSTARRLHSTARQLKWHKGGDNNNVHRECHTTREDCLKVVQMMYKDSSNVTCEDAGPVWRSPHLNKEERNPDDWTGPWDPVHDFEGFCTEPICDQVTMHIGSMSRWLIWILTILTLIFMCLDATGAVLGAKAVLAFQGYVGMPMNQQNAAQVVVVQAQPEVVTVHGDNPHVQHMTAMPAPVVATPI